MVGSQRRPTPEQGYFYCCQPQKSVSLRTDALPFCRDQRGHRLPHMSSVFRRDTSDTRGCLLHRSSLPLRAPCELWSANGIFLRETFYLLASSEEMLKVMELPW